MKKIKFMDCSFRDGFQSCIGARAKTEDFAPALEAAAKAGINHIEIGGGARFQSLFFYTQENAFEEMDKWRQIVGPDVNLQTLSRGVNVVGLSSQSSDIIDLHAKLFAKHGITQIRNFDALNDVRNLDVSGKAIAKHGLKHQITVTMMGLAPGLNEPYAHTPKFYIDRLQEIVDSGIPFDSLAFKDASGTSKPQTVYETVKMARELLDKTYGAGAKEIQFHTHDTAGGAIACNYAAIRGGADIIDLAMAPLSGGTCEADILAMYHVLDGDPDYTLDIDPEKILAVENLFKKCMSKYFMPPESMQVSPEIIFSPMPGGALTANTQMMRDNNCLDKYDACIAEMREVVARGGFGTSVTPVSQFYFQQAFRNAVQGKNKDGSWKMDPKGYGKMVLGYFGKTPVAPDPILVQWAAEQLGLEPTTKSVVELNDANPELGIAYNTEILKKNGLEVTEENIFISAACGDKGIAFLKGDKPMGIRYAADVAAAKKDDSVPAAYTVTVEGKTFNVQVKEGGVITADLNSQVVVGGAKKAAPAAGAAASINAPMPGTIVRVEVNAGDVVEAGQVVAVIEAMKMETEIKAEKSGTVKEVLVGAKEVVTAGQAIISIVEEGATAAPAAGAGEGTEVAAPMPGTIVRLEVAEGDAVEAEQVVAVIEAMKMETEIKSPAAGTVSSILVNAKDVVTAGQAIMTIK